MTSLPPMLTVPPGPWSTRPASVTEIEYRPLGLVNTPANVPAGPLAPVTPVAPVAPDAPFAPVAPTAPAGPVAPTGPAGPVAPTAPSDPLLFHEIGVSLERRSVLL